MSNYLGFEPTEKEKGYYFISYNNEDAERVGAVISAVQKKYNLPFWYDKGIKYNTAWDTAIKERIKQCDKVLLFFTKGILGKGTSKEEDESFVYKEYDIATTYKKDICFVLLDENNPADAPDKYYLWCKHIASVQSIMAFKSEPDMIADEIKKALAMEDGYHFYNIDNFSDCNKMTQSEILKKEFLENKTVLEDFFDDLENIIKHDNDSREFLDNCCDQISGEQGKDPAIMHNALKNRGSFFKVCQMIEKLPDNSEIFDGLIRVWFSEVKGDGSDLQDFRYRFESLLDAEKPVKEYFISRIIQLKNTIENTYDDFINYPAEQQLLSVIFTEIFKSSLVFSKSIDFQDLANIFDDLVGGHRKFSLYGEIIDKDVWRKYKDNVDRYCYKVIDKWFNGNNNLISCL